MKPGGRPCMQVKVAGPSLAAAWLLWQGSWLCSARRGGP